jgi:release factor glutamine methyltransferase
MQALLKRAAGSFLIPVTKWYLRKTRNFSYRDIRLKIFPGVFHPGLFSSTLFLLNFLERQIIVGKKVLELGCGSGLISIRCASLGANVTATDISENAISNTRINTEKNNATVNLIKSDLFENIPQQRFDLIIINPPYYAREVRSEEEHAWNCGANFEYFHKLFGQLPNYLHNDTFVLMVLTKGCDLASIFSIAKEKKFRFELLKEKIVLFDTKDFLYRIVPNSSA